VGLGATAVLLREPIVLAGTVATFGALAGSQWTLRREVQSLGERAVVEGTFAGRTATVDEPIDLQLRVTLPRPATAPVRVAVELPPGASTVASGAVGGESGAAVNAGTAMNARESSADGDRGRVRLTVEPGRREASTSASVAWSVPGRFRLGTARLTASDRGGLVTGTVGADPGAEIHVDPPLPRGVHLGQGGLADREATELDVESESQGGIDFIGVREYVPGDPIQHVDWKATARHDALHIRDFGSASGGATLFVVDARAGQAAGAPGRTKFDYLRLVALQFERLLRDEREPLGMIAVDDRGLVARQRPGSSASDYRNVRATLYDLDPSRADGVGSGPDVDGGRADRDRVGVDDDRGGADGDGVDSEDGVGSRGGADPREEVGVRVDGSGTGVGLDAIAGGRHRVRRGRSASEAERLARALDDGTAFGERLRPFYAERASRGTRIDRDPLVRATRAARNRARKPTRTVLFTDDTHRSEVREAVRAAATDGGRVLVFLTPSVLFDPLDLDGDGLVEAYDRLVEFESFRRTLDRMDDVDAYELGPGDRIETVMSAAQRRRQTREVRP